jgi:signal transduction histidine kinase
MNSRRLLLGITAPVIVTSLLLLGVGAGAAWNVHRLQKSVTEELRANISGVRAAEELEILVREVRTQLDHFLITGDKKYLAAVPGFDAEIDRWLKEAERWSLTPRERALTSRARAGYERFTNTLRLLAEPPLRDSLQTDIRDLIDNVLIRDIQQPTHEFLDVNEQEVEESMAYNQELAGRLVFALLLLGICGSGAGLIAGVGFARSLNRRLIQLTRQVLQTEQLAAVGQMAAGMAHELGNPLTSMKILVQAALADEETTGGANGVSHAERGPSLRGRDLLVVEEEITRMERLVQSLLLFGQPPQVEKRALDVRPLVEQTLGLAAARSLAAKTAIEFSRPVEPVVATVDPGQLRQVLLNLLLNAIDAAGAGGVVQVNLENGPDGGLTLRVADNGPGLPPALGSRIFAPFVTTKTTGLGLGLSICRRVAEAHGGAITAANAPQGGAEFTLRLPPPEKGGRDRESGVRNQESGVRNQGSVRNTQDSSLAR